MTMEEIIKQLESLTEQHRRLGESKSPFARVQRSRVKADLKKLIAKAESSTGLKAGAQAAGNATLGQTVKGWIGKGMKFGGGAGAAATLTFLLNLLADYGLSRYKTYEQTQKLQEALEDPVSFRMGVRENIAEREAARAVEAGRMRILQRDLAAQDPKTYALIQSLTAGDNIPRLGPGEARIGGSALMDPDLLDRAAAHSDLWDDMRGPVEPPSADLGDIWED